MTRRLLLLDVTAMSGDAVCVAGIDLDSGEQVRLNDPQPTRRMLAKLPLTSGGDVVRVDCKPLRPVTAPHVEDYKWSQRSLRKDGVMPFDEMRDLVEKTAFHSIDDAFGRPLSKGGGGNSAWSPGGGQRSLATLLVRYVRVERDPRGKIRIVLKDDTQVYFGSIPFQDLRVRTHEAECAECRGDEYLAQIKAEFDANRSLVRVGLTRPFAAHNQDPAGCWLQVTNILARPRKHF